MPSNNLSQGDDPKGSDAGAPSGVQGGTDANPQDSNDRNAYEKVNQDDEADRLRGTPDDRPLAARQESSDEVGTARPSKN
jgi:hypothetical protein